jgi:hypothetical protein
MMNKIYDFFFFLDGKIKQYKKKVICGVSMLGIIKDQNKILTILILSHIEFESMRNLTLVKKKMRYLTN